MTPVQHTANMTARDVQAALAKRGIKRDVTAKRVRQWVRDHVKAYQDDRYTSHVYPAALHSTIVAGIVASYTGGPGKPAAASRATSASNGRKAPSANVKREQAARAKDALPQRETVAPSA
jgi:hypothetical protein